MRRLVWAACAAALGLGFAAPDAALAQAYPTKSVRMIVPFPPGGATDVIARLVSQKLHEIWGQPVVLDYKPGAGTVIGTDDRREGAGGRLHDGHRDHGACAESQPAPEHALRHAQGPRRRIDGLGLPYRDRRDQGPRSEHRARADRARQEEPRQAELRLSRHRYRDAPRRRTAQHDGRDQHRPRALSRRSARLSRHHQRPGRAADRPDLRLDAEHRGEPGQADRDHQPAARAERPEHPDRGRDACPASTCRASPGWSCRAPRRATSSTRSTPP